MRVRSVTEEDYLKIIQELVLYQDYAQLSDIAKSLQVKRQSARDEINHLIDLGMVKKIDRGKYVLTDQGDIEANIFLRKHRTAEVLLSQCVGIEWDAVDREAMGIEHGMTEEIIHRVIERFNAKRCPHGNPIPSPEGYVEKIDDVRITDLNETGDVIISRIIYETDEILNYLYANQILPGAKVKIIRTGFPLQIEKDGRLLSLDPSIAKAIRVSSIK
ncbi:metal-dependent transcriptional regulator [Thermoplasma volcanium]|nr:metal-dependent transcriptional regulator [Thermoplasma volcanium]